MLEGFYHYYSKLGEKIEFTPYYILKQSDFYDESNPKNWPNCVSGGRYCASKVKELNITEPINIINEDIRQKCIYNEYKADTYFKYMRSFHDQCMFKNSPMFNLTCSEGLFQSLGIDKEVVKQCLSHSFTGIRVK